MGDIYSIMGGYLNMIKSYNIYSKPIWDDIITRLKKKKKHCYLMLFGIIFGSVAAQITMQITPISPWFGWDLWYA